MVPINHLVLHARKYGLKHKPLYALSIMLFFWSIFDGVLAYLAPILITERGVSKTMMGLILGSSSIAGAIFDFLLSKAFTNTHYRRIFILMFILSFSYPVVLFKANTISLFILAMAIWGGYFDLMSFGTFDFVSRETDPEEHASSFGVIDVFRMMAYSIAPIIASSLIISTIDSKPFVLAFIFLAVAAIFYFVVNAFGSKAKELRISLKRKRGVADEFALWKKLGRKLLPVLIMTTLLSTFDAFFWSVGPLYSESLKSLHPFGGFLLTVYIIPSLFMGWFVGKIVGKYGKKNTAFMAFAIGSLFLIPLAFTENIFLIIGIVFLAASMSAIAWPAIRGAYADYISEDMPAEAEIEGVADFSNNAGYVVGPILAGLLADRFGNSAAFAVLGASAALIAILLKKKSPKHISVKGINS